MVQSRRVFEAIESALRLWAGSVDEFFAAVFDEFDDEGGPAGLVGGAEAFAGFGVEVFVEEEEVLPVGDVGVAGCVAEAGAVSVFVWAEE